MNESRLGASAIKSGLWVARGLVGGVEQARPSYSRRRRMLSKINDLSHMAFVNIKPIESITYAFYTTSNGQVLN